MGRLSRGKRAKEVMPSFSLSEGGTWADLGGRLEVLGGRVKDEEEKREKKGEAKTFFEVEDVMTVVQGQRGGLFFGDQLRASLSVAQECGSC